MLANDGQAALDLALAEPPDLAVVDWSMPRLDGIALTRALRAHPATAEVPVLLLTAHAQAEHAQIGYDAGRRRVTSRSRSPPTRSRVGHVAAGRVRMSAVSVAGKKILIVEDDADIRQLINLRLRARSYETAFASDAITAMTVARKESPDLVLLDLGLPGGDGFLIMERMKAIASLSTIPVIVITASDPAATRDRALAAGAQAFLSKPIDMAELAEAVERALDPAKARAGRPGL